MNSFITNLNRWSSGCWDFGGTMLWQSSVLIVVVFVLDLMFRRKLRASVRYALWLVVLLKLCLPPSVALPTSPVWWLHKTPPPIAAKPLPRYVVTYDNGPLPEVSQASLATVAPAEPTMNKAAWALVVSTVIGSGLLLWLLVRWWQIARLVRHSETSERLTAISDETQRLIGMNLKVPVKLTAASLSPAVCGLFRPAILIPKSLVENFSDDQLRAVLLHELVHLRRYDVWLNFTQALLQIVYWWHPLVWLANARIRRLREEAVDDAVMLALRDEAESYAPTLLEVAKLALNRPLASLGLVGILESRHALRQRIERLVDFRAPHRAGLTVFSALGIFAFSAVALPMGDAPGPAENEIASVPQTVLQKTNPPMVLIQAEIYRMHQGDFAKIVSDPAFVSTRRDEVENFRQFKRLVKSSGFSPILRPRIQTTSGTPAEFYIGGETNSIDFKCLPLVTNGLIDLANHVQIISTADNVATTNETDTRTALQNGGGQIFSIKPGYGADESNIVAVAISAEIVTNAARFHERLQAVIKRQPSFQADATNVIKMPGELNQVVKDGKSLYEMGKLDEAEVKFKAALALDPENAVAKYYLGLVQTNRPVGGIYLSSEGRREILKKVNAIQLDNVRFDAVPLGEVLRTLAEESRKRDAERRGINFLINPNLDQVAGTIDPATGLPVRTNADPVENLAALPITLTLTNVPLAVVLDAVVLASSKPLKYSIQDFGIVFSPGKLSAPLYSRHFRVSTKLFTAALRKAAGMQTNSVSQMAQSYFSSLGVDLHMPGKSIFYNDGIGELFVRATQADLDKVENAVERLNSDSAPMQAHIKARFVEVPEAFFSNAARNSLPAGVTNGTGVLTATEAIQFWKNLQSQEGSETLAEPEAVTTSGRQTQMRSTVVQTIITNFVFEENSTNAWIRPETSPLETGPVLDVIPQVLPDGYTFDLRTIASLITFYGYATPPTNTTHTATNSAGETIELPMVLPVARVKQSVAHKTVFDGQTLVLFPKAEVPLNFTADEKMNGFLQGHIWESERKNETKTLVVLVTATIVDPAGNRVHSDDDLPFAQNGVPRQPPQPK